MTEEVRSVLYELYIAGGFFVLMLGAAIGFGLYSVYGEEYKDD